MGASANAVQAGLVGALGAVGVDLEDVQVQRAGRRELVRVVVDRDGGVDLDTIAEVSRIVADLLDQPPLAHEFAGAYVLEVTSPGVDRPLTQERHWRRAQGRLVDAELTDGQVIRGRVVAAETGLVRLRLESGEERDLAPGDLVRGVVQVEFNRTDEEG